MRYMSSQEIRETWLRFFENKGHHIVDSASLIPINDPTLLWVNAGVAPLKKYFDGSEKPVSDRLVNVQKCIRTNDIDNVGRTARHHTFFEMLGNFSIGDYFKNEAIEMGFELLTSAEYFGFPVDKLVFTYYPDDLDTKNKWISLGVSEEKVIPVEGNFWEIGEGPSGPNTEIFFDRGQKYDSRGLELVEQDLENDRYIEIWNIVFSMYNAKDGLKRIDYPELPNKNIDTGAGLERFACVIQGTETNFETDLFLPIIQVIESLSGVKYDGQMAFKVIADHIKTLVFSITDGAMLSNEGRGYVLRRILRRAVKYGRNLGFKKPFLHLLVDSVVSVMGEFYPNLKDGSSIAKKIILKEEEQFLLTIADGEKHIEEAIKKEGNVISGKTAFMLYDTYGFPIELTLEYAEEHGVKVDVDGFNVALEEQKERSRSARSDVSSMGSQKEEFLNFEEKSDFIGYDNLTSNSKVIGIFDEGIVLDKTPFYATSGGQVGDQGLIDNVKVSNVIKLPHGQHLHVIEGSFTLGQSVTASVNKEVRENTEKNHSATHLLHQALKDIYGTHVVQQGSLVNDKYLRFDFNHYENVSDLDILELERIVNAKIKDDLAIVIKEMPIDDAKKLGAMALFGEKYGNLVRVVNMDYGIELCGGTHTSSTNSIGKFAIISFESTGSGIYRITATTGSNIETEIKVATKHISDELEQLNSKVKENFKDLELFELTLNTNSYQDIINARKYLVEARTKVHDAEKALKDSYTKDIIANADSLIPEGTTSKAIIETKNIDNNTLKQLVDVLYDKIKAETLLLVNVDESSATFIAKTDGKTHAGNLIKSLTSKVNGSGGGRPNLAQGGTKDLTNLDEALILIKEEL